MKKYLLVLILILASIASSMAVKKIEANPINVAVMLLQEKDTAKMAASCEYYGYFPQTAKDDFTIFKHPNGSTIRYKLTEENHPIVEVTSKASAKEKDKILHNLNFHKNGNAYEQKSVGNLIKCASGPHGNLILTRYSKPKE